MSRTCVACLRIGVATAGIVATAPAAAAQVAGLARVAAESVVSVDRFADTDVPRASGMTLDGFFAVRLGDDWQVVAQPLARRLPNGTWIHRMWQLALRYEPRGGPMPVRIELGQIMSPIGAGALTYRPNLNSTLMLPATYFLMLPRLEPGGPRLEAITAGYPLGAVVTGSVGSWDWRAGVLDSSPVRFRRNIVERERPTSAQMVFGGGYRPVAGLRVGASLAHGEYAKGEEFTPRSTVDRHATVSSVEWEYAVRYTKVTGEWLHDRIETGARPATVDTFMVDLTQTITPRWFAATRVERARVRRGPGLGAQELSFAATDTAIGYRVNPEVSIRAGHVARRGLGLAAWDHQVGVSLVWSRRWK
jgi:hypothetical protein